MCVKIKLGPFLFQATPSPTSPIARVTFNFWPRRPSHSESSPYLLLQMLTEKTAHFLVTCDNGLFQDVVINLFLSWLQVPGRGFVNTWIGVFKNITSIRPCDAALGFACIGILLFLRVSQESFFPTKWFSFIGRKQAIAFLIMACSRP